MNNVGRDIFSSGLMVLLGAWVFYETASYPPDVSMMPRLMATFIFLFSIAIIIGEVLKFYRGKEKGAKEASAPVTLAIIIPFLVLWAISIAVVSTIGFYVTMGMFWLAITCLLEGGHFSFRGILKHAGSCVAVIFVLYLIFKVLVDVPTPIGIFM